MGELLKANFWADFAYYRRSRLLLAFLLVFLLLTGLYAIPPLFTDSVDQTSRLSVGQSLGTTTLNTHHFCPG